MWGLAEQRETSQTTFAYLCVAGQQVRHLGHVRGAPRAAQQCNMAAAALRHPARKQQSQTAGAAGDDVLGAAVQQLRLHCKTHNYWAKKHKHVHGWRRFSGAHMRVLHAQSSGGTACNAYPLKAHLLVQGGHRRSCNIGHDGAAPGALPHRQAVGLRSHVRPAASPIFNQDLPY